MLIRLSRNQLWHFVEVLHGPFAKVRCGRTYNATQCEQQDSEALCKGPVCSRCQELVRKDAADEAVLNQKGCQR